MDVETVETPTPEVEAPETPEIDPAAIEAAKAVVAKEYEEKEASLRKGFDEIARRERAMATPKPEPEDVPDLDPEAQKVLDAYLERKLGSKLQTVDQLYGDLAQTEMERAAEKHGIDKDKLRATILDYRMEPADGSIRAMNEVFKKAADIVKGQSFDPEAERTRLREELLNEFKEQGVQVESIKPTRTEPSTGRVRFEDDDISPAERYRAASEALANK